MDEPNLLTQKGIIHVPGGGETKQNVSAWEVDTLHTHFNALLSEIDRRYQQRFEAQEVRYQQEFSAHEAFNKEKFDANSMMTKELAVLQERALSAAMVAQEKAVAAALQAAERAVSKAEVSNEKRFENQNEFRGQLKDQAATLATKIELGQLTTTMMEKMGDHSKHVEQAFNAMNDKLSMVISRIDKGESRVEGNRQGVSNLTGFVIGAIGAIGGVIGIVGAVISFTR